MAPRASRAVVRASIALCAVLLGCAGSSADGGASSELEPGEELPGGDTTNTLLFGSNAFIPPAENIREENEALFYAGNGFFNQPWVQAPSSTEARDGLGPLFNARSCSGCHFKDGRGRPPLAPDEAFEGILLRLSVEGSGEHGEPLPEPTYGGQLQPHAIADVAPEGTPRVEYREVSGRYDDDEDYTLLQPIYTIEDLSLGPFAEDVRISPRVAPAMIGLGLLEAIPLERLEELEDPDDADDDGISGRLNRVWDVATEAVTVGRFGWKAEQPSVRQQAAGAFLGDIGITSSLFSAEGCSELQADCRAAQPGGAPEIADELLDRVALYSRLLAVPRRDGPERPDVLAGRSLFGEIGCASCHVPHHETGRSEDLPEVSEQSIWPYTDLLLHDMGAELSDERPSFDAAGEEWRTPPLWGIGRYPDVNGHDRLLHDGRARGVAEAVLHHGGEGEAARDAFRALSADDRAALVAFVESL